MLIAIDGYEANEPKRVGIGRYAYEIIKHIYLELRTQNSVTRTLEFRIYLPGVPGADMPQETEWWRYKVIGPKKLWTFFGLPLHLSTDEPRPSVVFSPTHYIPRFTNIPRVMSIMDLSYLEFPELFKTKDLYQLVNWTKYSVAHAARILTISEFSKNAILKVYDTDKNKVTVTYPGLVELRTQNSMTKNIYIKYQLGKNYVLAVGTLQPRKNYERLIAAFAQVQGGLKQKFGMIELVIVGKKGWLYEDILAAPEKYGVAGKVKFLDFVPDEDLPGLYNQALCFVMPSLYEGFGLPVLEAMANKCPVVVSKVSSLPEIAGKGAVYIDPNDVESITKGILTAVQQRNLMQGKWRIKAGLSQVEKFSWETAAKKTLEVLEKIGSRELRTQNSNPNLEEPL